MPFVIADRVRETTTTTGNGTITLAGAATGFQTFSAAIGNSNTTYYTISNPVAGEWEVGIGTYSSAGNTLSRDTVLASSASGAKVTLSSGSKDVFVTQPAGRSLLVQSAGSGLFAGNAAFTANGVLYANATTTVATSSSLIFNGTNLGVGLTPVANNGIFQLSSYASIKAMFETATITPAAPSATTNFDVITQAVQYYIISASANFTLNIRGNSGTSLNTILQTGQSCTIALFVTNGVTAYYPTAHQVDGSSVTPKWQGGTAPTGGNASSVDIYVYTVVKTGSAAFTVFASQTKFA